MNGLDDLKAENEQLRNTISIISDERDHFRHLLDVVAEDHHTMQERNGKLQSLVNQYARLWWGKMVEAEQLRRLITNIDRYENKGCYECPHDGCGAEFKDDDGCVVRQAIIEDEIMLKLSLGF